jgi:cysteine desulfurase
MELVDIYGNPSSVHQDSRLSKQILREARNKIAQLLGCSPLEVIFNSGASEANNSILKSVLSADYSGRNEVLISEVEHPSIAKTAQYLESVGIKVHRIPVNRKGELELSFLDRYLSEKTALVSVMYANNETGNIFPVREVADRAHQVGAKMHSDCVQMLGKSLCDFAELNLDYASFSAHKFYSLKGTGFCYVRKSSPWLPLIHGGGQERHRRGGTENLTGLAALNIVLDKILHSEAEIKRMRILRDRMENEILKTIENVRVTGGESPRVSNTSSLIIDDVDGETLLMSLDLKGFSVSTGAACSSGNPEPSPVLLAMGLSPLEAQSSLRISLGWENSEEQIAEFVEVLREVVEKLRNLKVEDKKNNYAI